MNFSGVVYYIFYLIAIGEINEYLFIEQPQDSRVAQDVSVKG